MDDPDAGVSTTVYDVAGQVSSTTDARGETLSYTYDALGRKTRTRDGDGGVVAEWVFDTLEKGQLSSSTRLVDGDAYVVSVYGYDDGYRSLGETITIPSGEGVLAGDYVTYRSFYPDGSVRAEWAQGVAGLRTETLRTNYDAAGNPEWMYGDRTYVADTVYSPLGLVEQFSLGVNLGRENWQTFGYEEGTHRLASVRVDRAGVDPADVNVSYSYDPAGNPTSIADAGGSGAVDVQCFTYDYSRRVTGAWSQTATSCANGPGTATLGGPAPYGLSYTYDTAGNRASLVDHAADVSTT
jgi:YD repeat-containing protein